MCFNNIDNIKKVKCPVFIFHGKKDEMVPVKMAEDLAANYQSTHMFYISSDDDHNSIYLEPVLIKILEFLQKNCRWGDKEDDEKNGIVCIPEENRRQVFSKEEKYIDLEAKMFHC